MRILIVEDDKELERNLREILHKERYETKTATLASEAIAALEESTFDLVLLDINLPDGSGLDVLRTARRDFSTHAQVLILSAKSEIQDKIDGLDSGADDYLAKPFSIIELLARIRALLRRSSPQKETVMSLGDIEIDTINRTVQKNSQSVALTPKEFAIIELLFYHKNIILTPTQIAEHIYDDYVEKSSHIINMHIRNIRLKLASPSVIETVRGVGFRLGT